MSRGAGSLLGLEERFPANEQRLELLACTTMRGDPIDVRPVRGERLLELCDATLAAWATCEKRTRSRKTRAMPLWRRARFASRPRLGVVWIMLCSSFGFQGMGAPRSAGRGWGGGGEGGRSTGTTGATNR